MKLFGTKFKDESLSKKLLICLVLFFIVPLLVVAFVLNYVVSGTLVSRICEAKLEVLKQAGSSVESMIADTHFLSFTLISEDSLHELVRFYELNSYKDFERNKNNLNYLLQSLINSKPHINSISLSRDGEILIQSGDLVAAESTAFHRQASSLKGKPLWTGVYELPGAISKNRNRQVISMIRSVNDLYAMKEIAMLRISLKEESLAEMYKKFVPMNGGPITVIDAEGSVVSSLDKNLLQSDFISAASLQFPRYETDGYYDTKTPDGNKTVFYHALAGTSWTLLQIVGERELYRQIRSLNGIIVLCMLFCILFGILFSFIQDRSVIRPIKLISVEMEKIKTGNFDISLPVRNRDEIGDLSRDFVDMAQEIKELIDTVYKGKLREKEAELMTMEAQINPHFLYNTLDSIRWMAVKKGDFETGEQIEALSGLFRHVLNKGKEMTTLGEELEHLSNYIMIQKNRFGERIRFDVRADPGLTGFHTLKLVLQPLVENAILHGLENKVSPGTVSVSVGRSGDDILLRVSDDGAGTDEERIRGMLESADESHNVFALKNINDRIRLKFGRDYGLGFSSREGEGTTVEVLIPAIAPEGESES